jgi:RNA polymerase sigma factor (sigma-70 family)
MTTHTMTPEETTRLILVARELPLFRAAAEAVLVDAHSGLVHHVLGKFRLSDLADVPDLMQEGRFALLRAVRGYDPVRGYAWASYACRCIYQAMRRYLDQRHRGGRVAAAVDPAEFQRVEGGRGGASATEGEGEETGTPALPDWMTAALTHHEVAVVHARAVLGMSFRVIDRRLGLRWGTARAVWLEARERLRGAVGGRYGSGVGA